MTIYMIGDKKKFSIFNIQFSKFWKLEIRNWKFGFRRKPGYTLIEMLIVTAIFSTLVVILTQTFVSFNQLHRKVSNRAVLGQDMRYVMEFMTRAARSLPIDYSGAILEKDTQITFLSDGIPIVIAKRGAADCTDTTVASCLAMSVGGGAWSQLTSNRVEAVNFDVYVRPTESPFVDTGGGYPSDTQPFMTINLGLSYKAERVKENASLQAQTTVSSRVYQR